MTRCDKLKWSPLQLKPPSNDPNGTEMALGEQCALLFFDYWRFVDGDHFRIWWIWWLMGVYKLQHDRIVCLSSSIRLNVALQPWIEQNYLFFHTELPSSGYASPGMVFIFELVAFQNKGSIKLGYNWPYWFSGREQQLCGGLHRARGPKVGNAT